MNRAVIYCRVSTEEQATEGFSIQAQLAELRQYAKNNTMHVVEEYLDEGASGKNITGRPEMKRLLQDASKKKFDVVLVYKLDRLSRKLKDALEICEILEDNNVSLVILKDNYDTSTPAGKMMFQVIGSIAEMERSTIVERVKMGMNQRAKQGKSNGGSCLGYDNINKSLVVNEGEALIVKEVFNLAEQGFGYKAIANRINSMGFRTKRGALFGISTIKQILDNPIYCGLIRFNNYENWADKRRKGKNPTPILVAGQHEAIISSEQWDNVQELRQKRSHKASRSSEPYILSGLIKCPQCGHGMVPGRSKGKNGISYRYYVCGQHHNKGSIACRANSIRADIAEAEVMRQLSYAISKPLFLEAAIDKVNNKRMTNQIVVKQELDHYKNQLTSINRKINRLVDELLEGTISKNILSPKLTQLEIQQKELEAHISEIEMQIAEPSTQPVNAQAVRSLLTNLTNLMQKIDAEQQKVLLQMIIKDIQVTPDAPRKLACINLYFDFTLPLNSTSRDLFYKLYPDFPSKMKSLNSGGVHFDHKMNDNYFFTEVLPLTMIRFTFQYLIPPVDLFT